MPPERTRRISNQQRVKYGKEDQYQSVKSVLLQSELCLQEPHCTPCPLPDQLACSPSYQHGWLFILSAALPHSRLLRMALPAGLHSAPGVFCPDFSLAAGAEKARLFRISMTMACNAVTGVAGRPPAKFLVSATSNKLSRQGETQSWSSKRK